MIRELLFPRTDAGVIAQVVVVVLVAAAAATAAWRWPEARILAAGVALAALGLIGVRALH